MKGVADLPNASLLLLQKEQGTRIATVHICDPRLRERTAVTDFFFGYGPRSFKIEALRFLFEAVVLLGSAYLFGWDSTPVWIILAGFLVVTICRYIWWHFRPYNADPQPVTHYTNPRHTKT